MIERIQLERSSRASRFFAVVGLFLLFIVVIGGIGRLEGPFIGTILFFILREFFADLGSWYLMFLGLFAIVTMLIMPKGIAGWLAERFDLQIFPLGRRIILPKGKQMAFSQFDMPETSEKRSTTKVNDD